MNKNGVCTQTEDLPRDSKTGYKLLQEVGEYRATLRLRTWGKSMRLACYFETDNGQRFYLNAWRKQSGPLKNCYCPRDSGPDFAQEKDGTRWLLQTKVSRNGNVFWSSAEEL